MARTTRSSRSTAPATVTVDAVDKLVEKLNTLEGIEFVRDAWKDKAPADYGVVELSGEAQQLWADGHLLDSVYRVVIHLYVSGDDDTWPAKVQEKLEALESEGTLETTHTNSREFLMDILKVHWTWSVWMYGPLTWEEPAPQAGGT